MGKAKKTRKYAVMKKQISPKDPRLKDNIEKAKKRAEAVAKSLTREVEAVPTGMFFQYNTSLGPPFRVLVDTNFINFSIKNKLEVYKAMMDCLLAKCIPCISDCVMAELEKLGSKYTLALRLAKDPRFERLPCSHSGTYADDCIVERVTQHRCFIVATCDKDLKRRLRKIPGVPIMYVANRKYSIERMPEAFGAPRL
ncbi:rrna-processing protein fcf1 homolog [Nannochloropsis oceanica]